MIDIIELAVDHHHVLQFNYTDSKGEKTTRLVLPYELDGELLKAWDEERNDWRSFRLERIESLSLLRDTFDPLEHESLIDNLNRRLKTVGMEIADVLPPERLFELGVDKLRYYKELLKDVVRKGGAGAELVMLPTDITKVEKANLKRAANALGWSIYWLKGEPLAFAFLVQPELIEESGKEIVVSNPTAHQTIWHIARARKRKR